MLETRSLKTDLLALALLGLTLFLGASLLSYDPADPPSTLVYPQHAHVLNLCGHWGDLVSSLLLQAVGVGAYYVLLSLAAVDVALLTRRGISDLPLRATGWAMSLAGFSTLAAMLAPHWSPGPVIGAGGYLGAAGRGLLEMHFAAVGAYIVTLSLIFCGLLLSTDYLLVQLAALVVRGPVRGLGRGLSHVAGAYAHKLGLRRPARRARAVRPALAVPSSDGVAVYFPGRSSDVDEQKVAADDSDQSAVPEQAGEAANDPPAQGERRSLAARLWNRKGKPDMAHAEVKEALDAAAVPNDAPEYELPKADLLLPTEPFCFEEQEKEVRRKARILEKTFTDFGFHIRVVEIQTGPVIAQFEVELEAGLRLSRITGLADDLAIALRVPSVRIVAPIPGKNTVGIEVPNSQRQLVRLREVMEETDGKAQKMRIPLFLGKDVSGNPLVIDLTTLPHLLIAGRTGTGKSVCLNTIIVSMLMTRRPDEVRMLLIDPKMVELSPYKSLPHLMHPVVTDMRKAEAIFAWAVEKMEERYQLLARAGVRHLSVYNQLGEEELMERIRPESDEERKAIPRQMPYIVLVADEIADLMMTAAKEVEGHIIRLAQKSRAVGIHLVLATQKPTVDVITGLIKSNLPARISFQVASRTDSRVVLDEMGADKLLGNGDLLFLWPGTSTLIRGQGTYLSDDEMNHVIASVATSQPQFVTELVQLETSAPQGAVSPSSRDELYEAAVDIVIREGRGSVSLLQRALGIGYGRAARLIDFMAEDGIVGAYNGSQARDVMISLEQWAAMCGRGVEPGTAPAPTRPATRIQLPPPEEPVRRGAREALAVVRDMPDPLNRDLPRPAERGELAAPAAPAAAESEFAEPAAESSRDDEDFDLWDETEDDDPADEADDYGDEDRDEDDEGPAPGDGNRRRGGHWSAESA